MPMIWHWEPSMDADERLLLGLAAWLGQNALPTFVVLLALTLAGVTTTWWAVRRYAMPSEHGDLPPLAYLVVHMALGFALVVSAAGLFAIIAEALGRGEEALNETLGRADESFIEALRLTLARPVLEAFAHITNLGDPETLTALCVGVALLLAWRRRWLMAAGGVVAIAGNAALNLTLKMVFARVRPVHEHGLVYEGGFSFPSGHSSGAVAAYGMLAYLLIRNLPARWHLP